jgi:hypothetical protein
MIALLASCGALPNDTAESATPSTARPNAESRPVVPASVPYQVARSWGIPAGGSGRPIFIDPQYANEADLRRLGEQVRQELPNDGSSFVFIFDTERAARLQGTFDNSAFS